MAFPLVSRLAFDVMQARAEAAEAREAALLDRYHALKAQGQVSAPSRAMPAPKLPEPSPEELAVLAGEQAFRERAIADFMAQGRTRKEAEQIADTLAGGIALADVVPGGFGG